MPQRVGVAAGLALLALAFMIGLLFMPIVVVCAWGIEPVRRRLKTLNTGTENSLPRPAPA